MTQQQARQFCNQKLREIYPESEASAICEHLLEWITGTPPSKRGLDQQKACSTAQLELLDQAIPRLLAYEPVQYITGQAWFCGLPFYVNRHVLIPRPETEELVEWVISNCRFPYEKLDILDIGTGSGCIPLALKKRLGRAHIVSCDISAAALEVARFNSEKLSLPVDFRELNFLDTAQRATLPRFDLVISNPPYIPISEKDKLDVNVVAYEPPQALFVPDEDPLIYYRAIAEFGKTQLKKAGQILVEMHEDLANGCEILFREQGYATEIRKDMQGKNRMLRAWIMAV